MARTAMKAAGTAILAMTAAGWAMGLQVARADATNPKSAADCRAITDFDLRGKCWDALDQNDQTAQKDQAETKKREFGLGLHYPSIAAILPKREEMRAREQKVRTEEIRNQTLTLAAADQTPLGRLLLTSTDGAIWEQTDGDAFTGNLAPGDTVEVSKASLGGYMCHVSRWQSVRCQRDK